VVIDDTVPVTAVLLVVPTEFVACAVSEAEPAAEGVHENVHEVPLTVAAPRSVAPSNTWIPVTFAPFAATVPDTVVTCPALAVNPEVGAVIATLGAIATTYPVTAALVPSPAEFVPLAVSETSPIVVPAATEIDHVPVPFDPGVMVTWPRSVLPFQRWNEDAVIAAPFCE
jgi:hypothetical protein